LSGLLIAGLLCTAAVVTLLEIDITSSVDSKLARLVGFGVPLMDDPLLDRLTVVTIATRGYDARRLVKTLREQGQFSGDLVVLADKCSPHPESARIIHVPSEADPLQSKRFKTQVFDLAAPGLDNGRARSILFLDADIEVNKPLVEFMASVHDAESAKRRRAAHSPPNCNAWFNKERAWHRYKQGHVWQGGFFYLPSKEASGEFLEAWGDAIDNLAPGSLDQTALVEALRQGPRRSIVEREDGGGGDGSSSVALPDNSGTSDAAESSSDRGDAADAAAAAAANSFEICELPPGYMSYVPDLWSRLRGPRSTTFTHFTKSSETRLRPGKKRGAFQAFFRGIGSGGGGAGSLSPPRRVEAPNDGNGC
jgi:hypothetical protein